MIKSEDRTFYEGQKWSPEQLRSIKIEEASKKHGRKFCPAAKRIAPRSALLEQLDYMSGTQSHSFRPVLVRAS